ncbi:MAG TPA: tRNA lysidine(34) synthetase TilS [Candidatus Angelobacter sp.]|nr:tRNA lysidine(34) synthetase TilS [Candidatus Angelobacter sp.]
MSRKKSPTTGKRLAGGDLPRRVLQSLQHQEMVRAGDRVGVAVSGGADSVALLLLLLELREKLGIVLSAVHFNHKLRGKAADTDEKFVANLAAKYRLEFHCKSADVASKAKRERTNLEDAGRRARYDYFRSLVEVGACTWIAVAHTADDQAETVLAHILRGTGLAGLGGIHPLAHPVFRPLLTFRRAELRAYLRQKKQKWCEDATNQDTSRMRARIRKKLLPLLEKQFQPAVVEHLATLADLAREDEAFFDTLLEERMATAVQRRDGTVCIALEDLPGTPAKKRSNTEFLEHAATAEKRDSATAMSKRMVRRIVEELKQPGAQLGARHVEAVLELARRGHAGSSLPLPGGVEVRRERGALVFCAGSKTRSGKGAGATREFSYNIDLSRGSHEVRATELGCVFRFTAIDWPLKRGETSKGEMVLDRDRLRSPVVLRNWRPGDRLHPLGHRQAHKLKRLLNEKRVSRWERDGWPVVTSGGVLAWARGFPVAGEFAAREDTRAGIVIAEEQL